MSAISTRIPVHLAPGHTHAQSADETVGATTGPAVDLELRSSGVRTAPASLSSLSLPTRSSPSPSLYLTATACRVSAPGLDNLLSPTGIRTPGTEPSRGQPRSADAAGERFRTSLCIERETKCA